MRYETADFDKYQNERAKLRNAMTDLRFYAYRLLVAHKFSPPKQEMALEFLERLTQDLPISLQYIKFHKKEVENASPEQAETVFRACGVACLTFADELRQYDKK